MVNPSDILNLVVDDDEYINKLLYTLLNLTLRSGKMEERSLCAWRTAVRVLITTNTSLNHRKPSVLAAGESVWFVLGAASRFMKVEAAALRRCTFGQIKGRINLLNFEAIDVESSGRSKKMVIGYLRTHRRLL